RNPDLSASSSRLQLGEFFHKVLHLLFQLLLLSFHVCLGRRCQTPLLVFFEVDLLAQPNVCVDISLTYGALMKLLGVAEISVGSVTPELTRKCWRKGNHTLTIH